MFKELVKKNRSYRGYDESCRLTREELMELVDCARYAPSSVNAQPFQYYLVYEKEQVKQVLALTRWARALPDMQLPHEGTGPTSFIVICQDLRIGEAVARYQKDVGIVAQTMLLAATEMGFGGCMIGNYSAKTVKEVLMLEEHLMPVLIVALGKPQEEIKLTEALPGAEIAYYRDVHDIHYVPKRRLADIIIN